MNSANAPAQVMGSFHQSPFWKLRARFRECGLFDAELAQATGIVPVNPQPPNREARCPGPRTRSPLCAASSVFPGQVSGISFFPDLPDDENAPAD